jgi:hypothetical protein
MSSNLSTFLDSFYFCLLHEEEAKYTDKATEAMQ